MISCKNSPAAYTHPLRVLVCTNQELHDARQSAVLPERRVVGRAECQVPHEAHNGLDERPATGRVQQLHQDGQAVVQAHCVLSHLRLRVTRGQVTQGTHLPQQGSEMFILNTATTHCKQAE